MQIDPSFISSLFCYGSLFLIIIGFSFASRQRAKGRRNEKQLQERTRPAQLQYQSKSFGEQSYAPIRTLLTEAEQSFFTALRSATPPELLICPQVRLANLIRPTARNAKQNKYDFYRIQAKCVDFVLCDAGTTTPRLVIELDDASHQRADRQKRDEFVDGVLIQVGLPILHIPWQRNYDAQPLAEAIRVKVYGVSTLPTVVQTLEPVLANG